jgi:hypothetical protein
MTLPKWEAELATLSLFYSCVYIPLLTFAQQSRCESFGLIFVPMWLDDFYRRLRTWGKTRLFTSEKSFPTEHIWSKDTSYEYERHELHLTVRLLPH